MPEPIAPELNRISGQVVDAAYQVHVRMGPGLLECVYEACLIHELRSRGLRVDCQVPAPVVYKGLTIDAGLRLDILVENEVIVELKAVESLLPIHDAQLMTYLRLSGKRIGLLINFNMIKIRDGVRRLVM